MKANLTEIICIIDKSGSMRPLTNDVIGGMNKFIADQKALDGEANFTMVLFNSEDELKYDRVPVQQVEEFSASSYIADGFTAMYDSIGNTLNRIGQILSEIDESERPEKVMVCIMTEGEDNKSHMFTPASVKEMIKHQTEVYSWEFIFLGANIDVIKAAADIGISKERSIAFASTSKGVDMAYMNMSSMTSSYRSSTR